MKVSAPDADLASHPDERLAAIGEPSFSRSGGTDADSGFGPSTFGSSLLPAKGTVRMARTRRALVLLALLGCLGVFALARWLALTPYVDSQWTAGPNGSLVLHTATSPKLAPMSGQALHALGVPEGLSTAVDATLLHRSPRWQVNDALRQQLVQQNSALWSALSQGTVQLQFSQGQQVRVDASLRGYAGLGWLFWMLAGAALVVYLVGWVVVLAGLQLHNLLFLVMCMCHACNLLAIATETLPGLGVPSGLLALDLPLRLLLDASTGAAIVHAFALYPLRLQNAKAVALLVWPAAAVWAVAVGAGWLTNAWWWAQGLCLALGLATAAVAQRSYAQEPNPLALAMTRFAFITVFTLVLMSVAVAMSAHVPGLAHGVAVGASVTWYLFLGSLLVLVPFLANNRRVLREFSLLAGVSTVAASLDLMFVSLFSMGPFLSLAVAVFVAVLLYGGARQFVLKQMLASSTPSAERIFEHLYRSARALQMHPEQHPQLLAQLLRELFDPLRLQRVTRVPARTRVLSGGSAMVVPVVPVVPFVLAAAAHGRAARGDHAPPQHALMLRFAQRGQRLFTEDDARLAERVLEQLRRAVAYDQAVERGRTEERLRMAQDLHDDIGARLLTLMYQSTSPEMEDYIRHTLQDLKTLTRGLAAPEQTFSHAAGEWKADLTQRLAAARAELQWSLTLDHDPRLTVVQWSALTRILRELVSNALYHGHATRVEVALELAGNRLQLRVSDDGEGREPAKWAHGLGLGGVRKRAKALAGQVVWSESPGRGITCVVSVPEFDTAPQKSAHPVHPPALRG